MNEFLLSNYVLITRIVEFSAAVTGLILYKKYSHTSAKYFIWFLVYIAIIEVVGSYTRYIETFRFLEFLKDTKFRTSHWCATIFWNIGSALFFSFYYIKILKKKVFISILKVICLLFMVASIISMIINWDTFFNEFSPFITVSGTIVILLGISFYLIEILQNDKVLMFYKSINFIISSALLVWFIITTPLVLYNTYYSSSDWNFVFLRWQIFLFANMFMYLTFTFAFIYSQPNDE